MLMQCAACCFLAVYAKIKGRTAWTMKWELVVYEDVQAYEFRASLLVIDSCVEGLGSLL